MAAILTSGLVAYRELPVSALPQVDYPTIQVLTFYPGARPRRDGFLGDGAARAAVRAGPRPDADDLQQLGGLLGHHAPDSRWSSTSTSPPSRSRRAINVASTLPAAGPSESAHLHQDEPGRRADPDARALVRRRCRSRRSQDLADTRLAQKISQLSGVGLVSISGGQKPAIRVQANPTALSSLGAQSGRRADWRLEQANVNQAKGSFDGPQQASHHRRQRSALQQRPVSQRRRRLPQRSARSSSSDVARRHRRRREPRGRRRG